ncbi:ligand-binding sensor domain-containing diguanylate cyclase [Aerolutibacter ruishenii]|uniref:ligand-binding sensor domain-containing diguanylate cyclase n=1 Tax=Aerolutibacter ruishenii TaxID=686800 RepID=UPI001315AAD3|nr:diguanylate cyclase [Lysobacter ruishenii]
MLNRFVQWMACLALSLGLSGVALAQASEPVSRLVSERLPGAPLSRQFSTGDFDASPRHMALASDAEGRLLVGNLDGLLRFDGESWRLFELPGQQPVRAIAKGADGRLYVGSFDTFGWMEPDTGGGLVYRELMGAVGLQGKDRNVGVVWEVLPTPTGVYFQTEHALHFLPYGGGRGRTWPLPDNSRAFYVDGEVLYTRIEGQGFSRFVDGRFVVEPGGGQFATRSLPAMFPRKGWRLLVGEDGFYRSDARGITRLGAPGPAAFADEGAYVAVELRDGTLMVGTNSGELFRYERDLTLRQRIRIGNFGILALGTDSEDGLWVATEAGLHRLSIPSPWSVIGSAQGVQGRAHDFEWFDGALWLATSRGIGRLTRDAAGDYAYARKDWVSYESYSLLATTAGLLAGHREGIILLRKGAQRAEVLLRSDAGIYVIQASRHDPSLVFALGGQALYLLRPAGSGWEVWREIPTGTLSPWSMEELEPGELWFGDSRGAPQRWRLDLSTGRLRDRTVMGPEHGIDADSTGGSNVYLLDERVHAVVAGRDFMFDGRGFAPFTEAPFSLIDRPKELTVRETPLGAYAFTSRQLWHRARAGHPWTQVLLPADVAGGYGTVRVTADGVLRISTWKGLVQYDPTERSSAQRRLRVTVESVSARHVRTGNASDAARNAAATFTPLALPGQDGRLLQVPAGQGLVLRFSMVSMEAGAQFRYRLPGVAADWTPWGDAVLSVRPLPAGTYRLEVEGRSRAGREAQPLRLEFQVMPFWYETWWARALAVVTAVLLITGLVVLLSRLRTRQYLAANRELEQRVAERTRALEKANRQLTELATEDPLTGLCNRRVLETGLRREWNRCMDNSQPLSALMIDVDHFKKFNDDHGHLEGDHTLRQVAQLLRRHHDEERELLARYGGEEFSLLLPGVDPAQARVRAEALRETVANSPLGVTVSIGVAGFVPGRHTERDRLLRLADDALYRAKRAGRNRVEVDTSLDRSPGKV